MNNNLLWHQDPPMVADYMNFYLDKSKRILGVGADHVTLKVLGATNGPIPLKVGTRWFLITTDAVISSVTDLDTGTLSIGSDYYVYACDNNGVIDYVVSLNTTYPTGYTANTSRKIGGFHTLPGDVGTISGHALSGYVALDILPASIWDLKHRARNLNNTGLVYDDRTQLWIQIYDASDDGASGVQSVYGATILDTIDWNAFVERGGVRGMRLLTDPEYQIVARGSNEETNVYDSNDPVLAGRLQKVRQSTGSGLSDITLDASLHTLGGSGYKEYEVTLDATGTPDTFKWRSRIMGGSWGGYTSGVAITGDYQTLEDNVKIKFTATTGHTLNNVWTILVSNLPRDTNARSMISDLGILGLTGSMWSWLQDQSFRWDMPVGYMEVRAAEATATVYHAASPGGNPVYLKFDGAGNPYLCCNMASATADKVVTFGTNQKLIIKHDASAATGGYQVYMNRAGTEPGKILCNIANLTKNAYIHLSYPEFFVQVVHDASAASNGVPVYYDDGADNRLEATFSNSANNTFDTAYFGPAYGSYNLPGTVGSLYKYGTYGDVKLLAGGPWSHGSSAGSRCRVAGDYRWNASSAIGGRFAVPSL